jgi:mannose-1-phosphate guanylyltransferase
MSVGHKKDKIKSFLENGEKFGVSVKYLEEENPLGTAGALKQAENLVDGDFIVSNSDELKNIDILEMYRIHKERKAIATIALTTVSDPHGYGVASLSGSKIVEFTEKPKKGNHSSNLINAGFYIFSSEIFDYIPKGKSSLEKDVFPKLVKEERLFGYPFSGQWYNTSTIKDYEKAIKNWVDIR